MNRLVDGLVNRFVHRRAAGAHRSDGVPDAEQLQRGSAAVSVDSTQQGRLQGLAGLVLLGGLGLCFLAWYYGTALHRPSKAAAAAAPTAAARTDAEASLPPLGPLPSASPAPPREPAPPYLIGNVLGEPASPLAAVTGVSPEALVPATAPPARPPPGAAAARRADRLLEGAVFVRPTSVDAAVPGVVEPAAPRADAAGAGHAPAGEGAMAALLASTPVPTVQATRLATQRLLLPKGSFLDCTLETAIDSSLPGLVTCLTAVDTFSADGSVVLLERGTKLIGETRGDVAQGASRIFVLWNEARTPLGIVVPLASPGTDALGRSGLPGSVNRHFWDRFGAAILVSMIDGAVQAAAAHQSSGNGAIVVNPSGTRDISTEILRSTINIPPTVTKHQGDRIQVLVARDLDFRSVYALRAQAP